MKQMPDVASSEELALRGNLDKVGMANVSMPVRIKNSQGEEFMAPALCDAFISLDDPNSKGIHMSRLYLKLEEILSKEVLNFSTLKKLLEQFKQSHGDLSHNNYIEVKFDLMEKRKALKSDKQGWRAYPVKYKVSYKDKNQKNKKSGYIYELGLQVMYSSTCPCSAALARQLIQEGFRKKFDGKTIDAEEVYHWLGTTEGISATPHSQRSYLDLKLTIQNDLVQKEANQQEGSTSVLHPLKFIDLCEEVLATPVQTAVKRVDEQEFARLNAQNLMFCEDAARRMKKILDADSRVQDYHARVRHIESLHAHDAVSVVTKGLADGYRGEE